MFPEARLIVLVSALAATAAHGGAAPSAEPKPRRDEDRPRARAIGLSPGVLPTGPLNAITDVSGVLVGQTTLVEGDSIRTGITAILPHGGNLFQQKVPAAIHVGNGFGKLIGSTQVEKLGVLESPIVLTNTLSVWEAANAVVTYLLSLPGNEDVRSINPVVGETNDGLLNDIRGRHVKQEHVLAAIRSAATGPVTEGSVGAGTGTVCFGFKGGIGTSSRRLPKDLGGYTVGVLVQSNFGGVLQMDGLPVGVELGRYYLRNVIEGADTVDGATAEENGPVATRRPASGSTTTSSSVSRFRARPGIESPDGSIMMVVATDAPLRSHGLKRLARRAMLGVARTGGISSHGSGDYVIAFSTAAGLRSAYRSESRTESGQVMRGEALSPLFLGVIEATEEAIYNSLLKATTVSGRDGRTVDALPLEGLLEIGRRYNRLHPPRRPDTP